MARLPFPCTLPPPATSPVSAVDFRRSLPPIPRGLHSHLAGAMNLLAEQCDLSVLTHQTIPRGSEKDRIAGVRLLSPRFNEAIAPDRCIISNGTQSALLILLRQLVGPGNLLVAERLSYGALRSLSGLADVRLQGLDIDENGILPESFLSACRTTRPKALYCNPTVQNPTTAIMPVERRLAIAAIARQYNVAIIEDDALGRLHPDATKSIAAVAPDVTWYVMSTTKCLAHGLRLAYLVAPSATAASRMIEPVERLSYWHPSPLLTAIATQWVENAVADEISQAIADECGEREAAAREILGDYGIHSKPGSMHIWLPLPEHVACGDFAAAAERDVLMRTAGVFAVDEQSTPNAVRLSLSTPASIDEVRRGLDAVRALLQKTC